MKLADIQIQFGYNFNVIFGIITSIFINLFHLILSFLLK